MSRTVEYKCDLCGHTQNTEEQMWPVAFIVNFPGSRFSGPSTAKKIEADWCRACLAKRGFVRDGGLKPEEQMPKIPPLEQLVREIIREEIQNATGA